MRLICPSCGAQYEVDESVIPETGRDVQCSNCGHAWFQSKAEHIAEAEEAVAEEAGPPQAEPDAEGAGDDAGVAADAAEARDVPEAGDIPEAGDKSEAAKTPAALDIVSTVDKAHGSAPPPAPDDAGTAGADAGRTAARSEPDIATDDDSDEEPDDDGDEPPLAAAPKPELKRRKLDDTVLGVLREEAERENRVRKVEEAALESQPDLGLAAMAHFDEEKTRDRVVRVRGDEDDLDDDALVARASRRELLPDIEEIKSTLRATSERGDEPAAIDAPETLARRHRSGFRRGFAVSLLVALIAVLIYLLAPTISASVPALEPALNAYVEGVNAARIWLDTRMQSLTEALKS